MKGKPYCIAIEVRSDLYEALINKLIKKGMIAANAKGIPRTYTAALFEKAIKEDLKNENADS
jgi:predicted transcriptional regulator